jgi:hypothetical protein
MDFINHREGVMVFYQVFLLYPKPVFVDPSRSPEIEAQSSGPVRNPICRTGPPGYIGWRNRFLRIDSWGT